MEITGAVEKLLRRDIESVGELDILLLLRRTRDRRWSADAVSRELRTSPESAHARLEKLARKRFLGRSRGEYQYAASDEVDASVGELARAYAKYRTRVITLIFG